MSKNEKDNFELACETCPRFWLVNECPSCPVWEKGLLPMEEDDDEA